MSAVTGADGYLTASYRYNAYGEMTFGKPQYENVYGYNGESYNPNLNGQDLRARYYNVGNANFFTEDSYLGDSREPLSLNRYNYVYSSYLNYVDPSGKNVSSFYTKVDSWTKNNIIAPVNQKIINTVNNLPPIKVSDGIYGLEVKFEIAEGKSEADLCSTLHQIGSFTLGFEKSTNAINILPVVSNIHKYLNIALGKSLRVDPIAYKAGNDVGELYKIILLKEIEDISDQLLLGLSDQDVRLKLDALLAGLGGSAGGVIGGAGGAGLGTLALPGGGTVSLGSLGATAGTAAGAAVGITVSETVQAIVNISLTGVNYAAKAGKENIESRTNETLKSRRMVGENGTKIGGSKTTEKNGKTERIDIENPAPGKRPGNIHYHEPNNSKWRYDIDSKRLVDPVSGTPAPQNIQDVLNETWFKKGIEKGLQYLGE